jgi:hypothetical protein
VSVFLLVAFLRRSDTTALLAQLRDLTLYLPLFLILITAYGLRTGWQYDVAINYLRGLHRDDRACSWKNDLPVALSHTKDIGLRQCHHLSLLLQNSWVPSHVEFCVNPYHATYDPCLIRDNHLGYEYWAAPRPHDSEILPRKYDLMDLSFIFDAEAIREKQLTKQHASN